MLNKKQSFEQIERTIYWNTVRGNTPDTLNYQLEIDMLQEELNEFKLAVEQGSILMIHDGLLKALQGETSLEEIFKVTT